MQFDRGELHLLDAGKIGAAGNSAGVSDTVHAAAYYGRNRRQGMRDHGANAIWGNDGTDGPGHIRVWARGHHRRREDVRNNGMLRVEIPLGGAASSASKLVLIKDLTQEPVHPNTLRRIEYLRRSVTNAMKRLYHDK
jgi:hypothetical protein